MDVLRESGADIVPFSPLDDATLPDGTDGLYLGGGFPELHAPALAQNRSMRAAIQQHAARGLGMARRCYFSRQSPRRRLAMTAVAAGVKGSRH